MALTVVYCVLKRFLPLTDWVAPETITKNNQRMKRKRQKQQRKHLNWATFDICVIPVYSQYSNIPSLPVFFNAYHFFSSRKLYGIPLPLSISHQGDIVVVVTSHIFFSSFQSFCFVHNISGVQFFCEFFHGAKSFPSASKVKVRGAHETNTHKKNSKKKRKKLSCITRYTFGRLVVVVMLWYWPHIFASFRQTDVTHIRKVTKDI